jgi:hypothetical protein
MAHFKFWGMLLTKSKWHARSSIKRSAIAEHLLLFDPAYFVLLFVTE